MKKTTYTITDFNPLGKPFEEVAKYVRDTFHLADVLDRLIFDENEEIPGPEPTSQKAWVSRYDIRRTLRIEAALPIISKGLETEPIEKGMKRIGIGAPSWEEIDSYFGERGYIPAVKQFKSGFREIGYHLRAAGEKE